MIKLYKQDSSKKKYYTNVDSGTSHAKDGDFLDIDWFMFKSDYFVYSSYNVESEIYYSEIESMAIGSECLMFKYLEEYTFFIDYKDYEIYDIFRLKLMEADEKTVNLQQKIDDLVNYSKNAELIQKYLNKQSEEIIELFVDFEKIHAIELFFWITSMYAGYCVYNCMELFSYQFSGDDINKEIDEDEGASIDAVIPVVDELIDLLYPTEWFDSIPYKLKELVCYEKIKQVALRSAINQYKSEWEKYISDDEKDELNNIDDFLSIPIISHNSTYNLTLYYLAKTKTDDHDYSLDYQLLLKMYIETLKKCIEANKEERRRKLLEED